MRRLCLWALICLTLIASQQSSAGNEGGGGGKEVELEFAEIAYMFAEAIVRNREYLPEFADLDVKAFLRAHATTEVYAVETLCRSIQDPDGHAQGVRCLDAEYLPDRKQIRFSIEAWQKKNCMRKMGIVVHEFGRAAGIENGNYKYSARISRNTFLRRECAAYDLMTENKKNQIEKNGRN